MPNWIIKTNKNVETAMVDMDLAEYPEGYVLFSIGCTKTPIFPVRPKMTHCQYPSASIFSAKKI